MRYRTRNSLSWSVPIEGIAEICGMNHKTAYEWRHRVFATVDGYPDRIVLRDRIWIDENYINDTGLTHGYGEARKRGLSKQRLCIAAAINVHKNPVAIVCGHGKPSTKRMKDGLLSRLSGSPFRLPPIVSPSGNGLANACDGSSL